MESFRKNILQQIENIATGRIFTFRDLSFDNDKTANVAVLLSEQSKKGILVKGSNYIDLLSNVKKMVFDKFIAMFHMPEAMKICRTKNATSAGIETSVGMDFQ